MNKTDNPTVTTMKLKEPWYKYRFQTKSVEDRRPLKFNQSFPWWCSGYSVGNEFECVSAFIIAYLPKSEDLYIYWDDAFNIEREEVDELTFSDRFKVPEWFVPHTDVIN